MAASFPPYAIKNNSTIATLLATDTIGATHAGADAQITVKNFSNTLNAIYSGTLGLVSQPAANQVYQRDTKTGGTIAGVSLGQGAVPFTLTLTEPAVTLQYQVVLASNNATVLQAWTNLQSNVNASTTGTVFSAEISASLNWYQIQFRANGDNTSIITSANPFAVGEVVAFSGQSLAVGFVTNAISEDQTTIASLLSSIKDGTISAYGVVSAAYTTSDGAGNNAYNPPINYNGGAPHWLFPVSAASYTSSPINSTFCVQFLNRLIDHWGVPCAMVGYAAGSTTIAQFQPTYSQPSGVQNYTALNTILGAAGKFRCLLWMQGHQDADGSNSAVVTAAEAGTISAAYSSIVTNGLVPLFNTLWGEYPYASSNFAVVLASIPGHPYIGASTPNQSDGIEIVRQCYLTYAASIGAPYVDGHDVPLYTLTAAQTGSSAELYLHPTQAGNITLADHFYRAYLKAVDPSAINFGDEGPYITAASRSFGSSTIALTVYQPNFSAGATALTSTGTVSSLFSVFASAATPFSSSNYAVTNTDAGGSVPSTYSVTGVTLVNNGTASAYATIDLTISPTPNDTASPVALDVWFERAYDSTIAVGGSVCAAIYDNVATDGLPNGRLMMAVPPNTGGSSAPEWIITAKAPTAAITVSVGSASYNPGTVVTVSGTYQNGTPSSVAYYFIPNTTANATSPAVGFTYTPSTSTSGNFSFSASAPSTVGSYVLIAIMTFASSATAQNTTGSFTTAANIITVNTPATQTISSGGTITSALTITGGWSIYEPSSLDYQIDLVNWATPASQTISGSGTIGTYSLVSTLGLYEGAYEFGVRDNNSGAIGYSNPFPVVNSGTLGNNYPLPTLSNPAWAPVFHFDASNPAGTLFQGASASSTNAVNGSAVGFFEDAYGNQYSQATAAKQPTYVANVTNGLPGVRFVGSAGQNLEVVAGTIATSLASALYNTTNGGFCVFLVVKFNTAVPAGAANSNTISWGNYSKTFFDHLDPLVIVPTGGSNYLVFTYSGGANPGYQFFNAGTVTTGDLYKWVARNVGGMSGTDYIEFQSVGNSNGTIYTGGMYSPAQTLASGYNYSMIGGSTESASLGTNSYPFDGWIHEILVYTQPLTNADGVALINYATSKWGN